MKIEEALVEFRKGKKIITPAGAVLSLDDNFAVTLTRLEFISNNWEVEEESGKSFPEVFEAFKRGSVIRRKSWSHSFFLAQYGYGSVDCNVVDLLATDWEICE